MGCSLSTQGTNNISRLKTTIWAITAPFSILSPSLGSALFIYLKLGSKHLLETRYLARLGHRDLNPWSQPSGNSQPTVRCTQESDSYKSVQQRELSEQLEPNLEDT